jgi:hypothetical protein
VGIVVTPGEIRSVSAARFAISVEAISFPYQDQNAVKEPYR